MTKANSPGQGDSTPSLQEITVIPGPTAVQFAKRQIMDYTEYRQAFIKWLLPFGKDPEMADCVLDGSVGHSSSIFLEYRNAEERYGVGSYLEVYRYPGFPLRGRSAYFRC